MSDHFHLSEPSFARNFSEPFCIQCMHFQIMQRLQQIQAWSYKSRPLLFYKDISDDENVGSLHISLKLIAQYSGFLRTLFFEN